MCRGGSAYQSCSGVYHVQPTARCFLLAKETFSIACLQSFFKGSRHLKSPKMLHIYHHYQSGPLQQEHGHHDRSGILGDAAGSSATLRP